MNSNCRRGNENTHLLARERERDLLSFKIRPARAEEEAAAAARGREKVVATTQQRERRDDFLCGLECAFLKKKQRNNPY